MHEILNSFKQKTNQGFNNNPFNFKKPQILQKSQKHRF